MSHFFEITFFAVGKASKGGDAILFRCGHRAGEEQTTLIDGGYAGDYPQIRGYLPDLIHDVICSHYDQDHIAGLIELLRDDSKRVKSLWVPPRVDIASPSSESRKLIVEAVSSEPRLRLLQESLRQGDELLRLATLRKINIAEIKQSQSIGPLKVLSPSVALKKSLEAAVTATSDAKPLVTLANRISSDGSSVARERAQMLIEAAVSRSNEMSTVLWTDCDGLLPQGFLFTSDAGPKALANALASAKERKLDLSKLRAFQLPHHGSVYNFPQEFFDRIKAPMVFVSAPPASKDHPSEELIAKLRSRGVTIFTTQGTSLRARSERLDVKPLGFAIEEEAGDMVVYRINHNFRA